MPNVIHATNINDALAEASESYVKTAYKEQYEIECLGLVMSQDKWNGYDLLDAFKAGATWYREELAKDIEEGLKEINEKGFATFLKNHQSVFVQDANGDMMRKEP